MKKVLALVLAVVMVCTMAMAVTVSGATTPGITSSDYEVVNPGTTLKVVFDVEKDGINYYVKDGKFVPANNVVKVTYAKGGDLVESEGWVALDDSGLNYEYQIKLKANPTKIVDKKVADIQISMITFKSTGYDLVKVFAPANANGYISYAYGYEQNNVILQEKVSDSFSFKANCVNVVTNLLDKNGAEVNALDVLSTGMLYTFHKGDKVFKVESTAQFDASKDSGYTANSEVVKYENTLNTPAKVVYEKGANAGTTYRVYAKGLDGKVNAVVATTTDGVMTFTIPALSTAIVTTGVLTTVGTVGGTTTTPGTTTNPGTGANDVVGVAAALAVVALVSGAAISLKK